MILYPTPPPSVFGLHFDQQTTDRPPALGLRLMFWQTEHIAMSYLWHLAHAPQSPMTCVRDQVYFLANHSPSSFAVDPFAISVLPLPSISSSSKTLSPLLRGGSETLECLSCSHTFSQVYYLRTSDSRCLIMGQHPYEKPWVASNSRGVILKCLYLKFF